MRRRAVTVAGLALAAGLAGGAGVWWRGRAGAGPPLAGEMAAFETHRPGRAVPAVVFTDAEGRSLTFDSFAGRVVLVNLWATWCAPCVEEMPALDALEARLGGPDFQVVTLSIDQDGLSAVAPFFERHELRHLQPFIDPAGRAPAAFGQRVLPTSLVIDRGGRWAGTFAGPADWAGADAVALMQWFLDQPA